MGGMNNNTQRTLAGSGGEEILEFDNVASFPAVGDPEKLYVALDTNILYRWSGSAYVATSSSLALGETAASAYRGDRGKTAYDHSQSSGNPHGTTKSNIGLNKVENLGSGDLTLINQIFS